MTLLKFSLPHVPASFVKTAPWIFKSEVEVKASVDDCWDILMDDDAWQYWHPEVTNIQWDSEKRAKGASRTIEYKSLVMMILLAGPIKIWEHFDVWTESKTMKHMSFYFQALSRPRFVSYQAAREDYKVEQVDASTTKFTRIVAINPSFASRYLLGWLLHPLLSHTFETKCPRAFKKYAESTLNKTN